VCLKGRERGIVVRVGGDDELHHSWTEDSVEDPAGTLQVVRTGQNPDLRELVVELQQAPPGEHRVVQGVGAVHSVQQARGGHSVLAKPGVDVAPMRQGGTIEVLAETTGGKQLPVGLAL
jgi:hypothetical protein